MMFNRWGTIAFERKHMKRLIGFGEPRIDEMGVFDGWERWRDPSKLNVSVWLAFVPEVYRADVIRGIEAVGPRFLKTRIEELTIDSFIETLRAWIAANVEPR